MADLLDEEYEIPLKGQRYFGAGIKRKRVKFVPSSSNEATVQSLPTTPSQSAADAYLSIVFKDTAAAERAASAPPVESDISHKNLIEDLPRAESVLEDEALNETCDICRLPITSRNSAKTHDSSIVHQICLQHSYPPSHIDRKRQGLAVLERQGWDPDSRKGLGSGGEGILHPVKAKENPAKAGLGMKLADLKSNPVQKPVPLDAGKVRWLEQEGKKKAERLRNAFYMSEDMEKYLGKEGEVNRNLDMNDFKRARRR